MTPTLGAGEERFVDGIRRFDGISWKKVRDYTPEERAAMQAGTPSGQLNSAIFDSRSQAAAAIDSSRSGVDAILAQQPTVDAAIGRMNAAADAMLPLAGDMSRMGDSMWESGTKVTDQALETLGTGLGFINMDFSLSPLVAEALRIYGQFDPDRYTAQAAQDVQSQADNARAQTDRNLSRMGVDPTSGAYADKQSAFDRLMATARASAMTRARQQGLNDQATQFTNLVVNPANTFLKTGGELASIGSSAQSAAASAKKGAASVLGEAGNLAGGAGTLGLNYGKTLEGAYNALAGTQIKQAGTTIDGERLRVGANTGGGGRGGAISTNTGRHYGVGGELLETGDPKVDAQLQMYRDVNGLY